ncbi:MAG TPA: hypothetical protein VK815_15460 [Candidatus Acidoferrales bacterium]|jgi:hypothetical protein|nr:hypothetical protein [Candidatus Acidoferrales bacterium]
MIKKCLLCCLSLLLLPALGGRAQAQTKADFTQYQKGSGFTVATDGPDSLRVAWAAGNQLQAEILFDLREGQPLIRSLGVGKSGQAVHVIATALDPVTTLTIGERDQQKADEGYQQMVFFEKVYERPHQTYLVTLTNRNARVISDGSRLTVALGGVTAGSFNGDLRFSFFRNSLLIHAETVVSTHEKLRAILYDSGLSSATPLWTNMVWDDPLGKIRRAPVTIDAQAQPVGTKFRTMVAEGPGGSVAVFPAPHQYFYPLDFADNFKFNWFGTGYGKMPAGFGFGIRQPPEGDKRWVPWFDAPADTEQHLGVFYLLNPGDGEQTLAEVARYTHEDRYQELAGYKTFTSHYHIEHTLDFLSRQKQQKTNGIPAGLETPGFVTKFKDAGVNIVHLAEFHQGWTPTQKTPERLKMMQTMFSECGRLSGGDFLLLPGEEPNVHLGGHWIALFPKPVYWILNRATNEPFADEVVNYGKVYHVGNADDVLALMERENGLMWTAHARIKGSIPYPDGYRNEPFYQSDHFLGAAWKALPANLSHPTLGWRALDLFNDMNQWGQHKQVLGEVDVFQVQPDYELYGHMNINYLKLDRLPKFSDGWQPVLDTLRHGQFFTTTGEILIPQFTAGGKASGETIAGRERTKIKLRLDWTFPLSYVEIISGDGKDVRRQKVDLTDTDAFGSRTLNLTADLRHQKWVRVEVWDVAANGAFTQPVWVE